MTLDIALLVAATDNMQIPYTVVASTPVEWHHLEARARAVIEHTYREEGEVYFERYHVIVNIARPTKLLPTTIRGTAELLPREDD